MVWWKSKSSRSKVKNSKITTELDEDESRSESTNRSSK